MMLDALRVHPRRLDADADRGAAQATTVHLWTYMDPARLQHI